MNDFTSKYFVDIHSVGMIMNTPDTHHYEVYNPNKSYRLDAYLYDYGFGTNEYTNVLIVGLSTDKKTPLVKYVASKKNVTDEEFEKHKQEFVEKWCNMKNYF